MLWRRVLAEFGDFLFEARVVGARTHDVPSGLARLLNPAAVCVTNAGEGWSGMGGQFCNALGEACIVGTGSHHLARRFTRRFYGARLLGRDVRKRGGRMT